MNFVNVFIDWVQFSHGIQRDHILCYFDKERGPGSTNLPNLKFEFVMSLDINKYIIVSSYLTVSKGLIENH